MAISARKTRTQDENIIRIKGNVMAVWVHHTGLAITSEYKGQGFMCDLDSIEGIPIGQLNEREIQVVGKDRQLVNDGQEVTDFSMTVHANSVKALGAMIAQNTAAAASYAISINGDQGQQGSLILYCYNKDGDDFVKTILVKNLSVKFNSTGPTDDDGTYPITFYSKKAEVWVMEGSKTIVAEHWYDDTVVINANAPNGVLQTFDYGTGNDSYSGATNPTPLDYAGRTGHFQYHFGVWLDGAEVTDPSEITVTIGVTDQFTFVNTTPADGAALCVIYPVDADSFDLPTWYEALYQAGTAGTNGGALQSWQNYIPSN